MASRTVLRDGFARFRLVLIVVAAEATGERLVPDIIGIRAPGNVHAWIHIGRVYLLYS